jgi:Zn-dependent peptidase ImmA (M78 family)/transcriptional regulator with XRE-family HTH domain
MTSQQVPITGTILAWARDEAGLTVADLAVATGVEAATVAAWESGDALPSSGQFTQLVGVLRRPSALFFLPAPPRLSGLPTSLRSAPGLAGHTLSQDEVRQLRWARRIQQMASWVLREEERSPVVLPRSSIAYDSEQAAAEVRRFLDVSVARQLAWRDTSEALRAWRTAVESRAVLVFQLQLGKSGIRGFSAWDDRAPIVAVNSAYHVTARIFTLFHELGHMVTRTDAACLRFVVPNDSQPEVERWCERFAAELLLPADTVREVAARMGVTDATPTDDIETARRIANRFKVSTRATSLRLQELQLAPQRFYEALEVRLSQYDWSSSGGGGGGQPRVEKRLGQLGYRAPEILIAAKESGRITQADLCDYLNLTTGQVDDLRIIVPTAAG